MPPSFLSFPHSLSSLIPLFSFFLHSLISLLIFCPLYLLSSFNLEILMIWMFQVFTQKALYHKYDSINGEIEISLFKKNSERLWLLLTSVHAAKHGRKGNVIKCNSSASWTVKRHFKDHLKGRTDTWRQALMDKAAFNPVHADADVSSVYYFVVLALHLIY